MVRAEAITIAKSLDGDDIMNVIKSTTFDAPYYAAGAIRFDDSGQNEILASYMVQTQGGKYHAVYPADIATAEPVVPIPAWDRR